MIARSIKETHVLYIRPEKTYKDKMNHYLMCTNTFSYVGPKPSKTINNHHVGTTLDNRMHQIIQTLDMLYHSQAITNEQYEHMTYFKQLTTLEVNKLDFSLEFYRVSSLISTHLLWFTFIYL